MCTARKIRWLLRPEPGGTQAQDAERLVRVRADFDSFAAETYLS
jgi:hypothetical protein